MGSGVQLMATGDKIKYSNLSENIITSIQLLEIGSSSGNARDGYFYTSCAGVIVSTWLEHTWGGFASKCNLYVSEYNISNGSFSAETQVISNTYDQFDANGSRSKYVSRGSENWNNTIYKWRFSVSDRGTKRISIAPLRLRSSVSSYNDSKELTYSAMSEQFYNDNVLGNKICRLASNATTNPWLFVYGDYDGSATADANALVKFNPSSFRGTKIYASDEPYLYPKKW